MTKAVTPEEIAALRAKIAEAEAAYHDVVMGVSVFMFIDQNGERVAYNKANAPSLYTYIQQLKADLPDCDPGRPVYPKPLKFWF